MVSNPHGSLAGASKLGAVDSGSRAKANNVEALHIVKRFLRLVQTPGLRKRCGSETRPIAT